MSANKPTNKDEQNQQQQNETQPGTGTMVDTFDNNRLSLPLNNELLNMNTTVACNSTTPLLAGSPVGINAIAVNTNTNASTSGFNLSLMQSSPPPHSYRHSRAYRHFKNPPQPHMCIRTTTDAGEELFINVLSWTRIVIPQEPSDPIPLYGGMRVPPGSPRSPPIVFAVMANPEVLKDSGRHSKDPEERRAMVELMCDFVEAMNPGVKLVRNAVILKDRDISGELKDVWNAVQAQRDREREEQIMQQRQQQHCHNNTTQQMFPKSPETVRSMAQTKSEQENTETLSEKQLSNENRINVQNMGITAASSSKAENKTVIEAQDGSIDNSSNECLLLNGNSVGVITNDIIMHNATISSTNELFNTGSDQIDAVNNKSNIVKNDNSNNSTKISQIGTDNSQQAVNNKVINTSSASSTSSNLSSTASKTITKSAMSTSSNATTTSAAITTNVATTTTVVTPVKKEKLGGFLPNGCIFPRFKNNKNKDKESKPKEKTLLNALKKSKEKKVAPIEHSEKATPETTDTKSQYEKNCINLESEVQKLDINKIDTNTSNDMFIKLKVTSATSAAAAK
ncbi:putative mediator of RNA polymerase II transcription subunit 26 [Teleopsis dalmanni]|uniref:putative mediator of RNA polymerase II transcription subunit 26 n=1 Tax=Teleopsis dalmanni TaxID=139649 RepID=UPI0018CECBDE|nr:putative mediator of RNA polymerase II transcription subunit 26 [Teleopsis dalmanni]